MHSKNAAKFAILAITFTIIFSTSSAFAATDYSEWTDEELIDRLKQIIKDMDQAALSNWESGEIDEAKIAELWQQFEAWLQESREVGVELEKRGIEIEVVVGEIDANTLTYYDRELQHIDTIVLSPKKQVEFGVEAKNVTCKTGLELILKQSDGSPTCVKPTTAEKLIERGWAR